MDAPGYRVHPCPCRAQSRSTPQPYLAHSWQQSAGTCGHSASHRGGETRKQDGSHLPITNAHCKAAPWFGRKCPHRTPPQRIAVLAACHCARRNAKAARHTKTRHVSDDTSTEKNNRQYHTTLSRASIDAPRLRRKRSTLTSPVHAAWCAAEFPNCDKLHERVRVCARVCVRVQTVDGHVTNTQTTRI